MKIAVLSAAVVSALAFAGAGTSAAAPRIDIPSIGFHAGVFSTIDDGPAWWARSGRPGGGSTVAIAAHRTWPSKYAGSGPFRRISELKRGDLIYVSWQGTRYSYVVTGSRVRPRTDLHIADPKPFERLILSACSRADGSPTSDFYVLVIYGRPA